MQIRPIRSDEDHVDAMREIERLWGAPEGTPDGDKLDVLATLVDAYERDRWPSIAMSPRDMLEYAVTEMGHSQVELSDVLGARSMASELLTGKRKLTLAAARKISAAWHIPIQLLVAPYPAAP